MKLWYKRSAYVFISEEVDINWKTYEGETALLLACQQGYTECAERLLEAGADKNLSTNEIITPLFEGTQF